MIVVHEVWQRFLTTRKFTTALTFLCCACGTSARLQGWRSHSSMQMMQGRTTACKEHCTDCRTKLYAAWACCTVCNTHTERSCEAMAECVMFEADLGNVDSLSSTNFFRFGHCVNIEVRQDSFPAPVLSGKAIFALQRHSKVFSSSARRRIHL